MKKEIKHVMGAKPSPIDIRDYKVSKKALAVAFPEEFACKEKVPVKNQMAIGSCVAHSTAEILEYQYNDKMATDFVYGIHHKLFGSEGPGMYPREAAHIVWKYGNVKYEDCSTNTEVNAVYPIAEQLFDNKEIMDKAYNYHISSYAKINSATELKFALMNYGPVLGAVAWYDDNTCDRTTGLLTKGKIYAGGHAIMIYGWNKEGWLCQNSWGTSWGKKGRFILPYSYNLMEAWSFVPKDKESTLSKSCTQLSWFYKAINWIVNLFTKKDWK